MSYTISNTERTKQKGADYETFSTLYMLGYHSKKKDLHYVFVDCFNDVSCSGPKVSDIYDIQAKGYSKISPGQIGRFFYTLLKNFRSGFPFVEYILFLENVDDKLLLPMFQGTKILQHSSFTAKAQKSIKDGLEKELKKRENKKALSPSDYQDITNFLNQVQVVVCFFNKIDAIKKLIPLKNVPVKRDEFYEAIFDEIRRKENELKMVNVEGVSLNTASDILQYQKFIEKNDIDLMLINSFIGSSLFGSKEIPIPFVVELNGITDKEESEDLIQNCNSELARMFFNKNDKKNIWKLLLEILRIIKSNTKNTPSQIFSKIPDSALKKVFGLSECSVKYFIAKVMEGLS